MTRRGPKYFIEDDFEHWFKPEHAPGRDDLEPCESIMNYVLCEDPACNKMIPHSDDSNIQMRYAWVVDPGRGRYLDQDM